MQCVKHAPLVIKQSNSGELAAYKNAVFNSRYDYVRLLDSDDYFLPSKLQQISKTIQKYNTISENFFLCHNLKIKLENQQNFFKKNWFEHIHLENLEAEFIALGQIKHPYPFAIPCGQVYSRKLLQYIVSKLVSSKAPIFDAPMPHGAFLLAGGVHCIQENLSVYRVHGQNNFMQFEGDSITPQINKSDELDKITFLSEFLQQFANSPAQNSYIDDLVEVNSQELVGKN